MIKRALLILNPLAGRKRGEKLIKSIVRIFREQGYYVVLKRTRHHGDAVNLCRDNIQDADLVVPIGGDGTLNQVIDGMMKSGIKKPIGFIPAGSSNVFSGNLGFPRGILRATRNVAEGTPKPLDIGMFNDRYFSFITSFGAFTKTSWLTPQKAKNSLGQMAYFFQGIKDFSSIKPIHAKIIAGDRIYEDDYIFGSITNSLTVAGIIKLDTASVDLNDGSMEILLIKYPQNGAQFTRTITALNNKQYDPQIITYFSASKVEVQCPKETEWSVDGEFAHWTEKIEISVLQNAIDFVRK